MRKKGSSSQADTAVFSRLREENAALKQEVEELCGKLERMNELLLNAQRARFGQSSEKREYYCPNSWDCSTRPKQNRTTRPWNPRRKH